jgi:hypothetical protein
MIINRRTLLVTGSAVALGSIATITLPAQGSKRKASKQEAGFKRQIKMGLGAMKEGNPVGAILVANAIYSWADYIEDNNIDAGLKQFLKKHGPQRGVVNHKEMDELAKELGVDTTISMHVEPEPYDMQKKHEDLVNGATLSARMRDAANMIVTSARSWPNAANIQPIQWPFFGNPAECPVCVYAAEVWVNATNICSAVAPAYFMGPLAWEMAQAACASVMSVAASLQTACLLSQVFGCSN